MNKPYPTFNNNRKIRNDHSPQWGTITVARWGKITVAGHPPAEAQVEPVEEVLNIPSSETLQPPQPEKPTAPADRSTSFTSSHKALPFIAAKRPEKGRICDLVFRGDFGAAVGGNPVARRGVAGSGTRRRFNALNRATADEEFGNSITTSNGPRDPYSCAPLGRKRAENASFLPMSVRSEPSHSVPRRPRKICGPGWCKLMCLRLTDRRSAAGRALDHFSNQEDRDARPVR